MKKYKVTLTQEEREELEAISSKGKHAAQTVVNALILLIHQFAFDMTLEAICSGWA